jgi:hypothetical protein
MTILQLASHACLYQAKSLEALVLYGLKCQNTPTGQEEGEKHLWVSLRQSKIQSMSFKEESIPQRNSEEGSNET